PGELGQARVGKAHALEASQCSRAPRQSLVPYLRLRLDEFADLGQKPGVDFARAVNVLIGKTKPHGLCYFEQSFRGRRTERRAHRVLVVSVPDAFDRDLVEPGEAVLQRTQCLLQTLLKSAAD